MNLVRRKIIAVWVCALMIASAFVMVADAENDVEGKEQAGDDVRSSPPLPGTNAVLAGFPTNNVASANAWRNPANGYSTNAVYTETGTLPATTYIHDWNGYNFASMPVGSTINGIEVILNATASLAGTGNRITVSLTWDGGTGYTAGILTAFLTTTRTTYTLGGVANLWGRTWADVELKSATNFRVNLNYTTTPIGSYASVDAIMVRVTYTAPVTATATATGPIGGPTNMANVTLTYTYSGTPSSVNLYYTKSVAPPYTWVLAGNDFTVDGNYAYTITAGSGTYRWIACAVGGGSTELSPPSVITAPEVSLYVFDNVAPMVSSTVPANAVTGVAMNANIVITFSESMNTATFTYTIQPNPGNLAIAWSDVNTIATITHTAFLPNMEYFVNITAATDPAGNALNPTPYSFYFETILQTTNPDELIIALQADMQDVNPWNPDSNSVWKSNQLGYNFESLMAYTPDYELYPVLAAPSAVGPNGADAWVRSDGMQISVNLKQGVTFHDGHVMNSQDVVFSYQTLAWGLFQTQVLGPLYWNDGTTFTRYDGGTTKIGVHTNGTYRVDIHLNQPYSMLWYLTMAVPIMPYHIWSSHTFPLFPDDYPGYNVTNEYGWDYSYGSNPSEINATIGTGPFYLESWTPGNGSVLKAYNNYWDKNGTTAWKGVQYPNYPQHVKAITFKIYTQLDAAVQALQNGDVHNLPWSLTPSYQNSLKINPNIGFETNKDQGFFFMTYNMRKGAMADVNFRRAVSYCVDKQYIVDRLMNGNGIQGTVPISVTNAFYVNTSVPAWIAGDNLAAAQALLDSSGYIDINGDGWREMPDGSPLKYNILTPPKDYDPIRADSGIMIEKNLKSIGLNVASVPTSFNTIVSAGFVSLDFDMYILGWTVGSFPESYLRDFFHGDSDVAINPAGSNSGGYNNATVDAMIDNMEVEINTEIRAKLIKDICGATMMDVAYNTLYYKTNIEAYRQDKWQGWVPAFGTIYNGFSIYNLTPPSYPNPSYGNLEVGLYVPDNLPADKNSTCYVLVTDNDIPVATAHVEVMSNFGTYIEGFTNSEGCFDFSLFVPFIEGQVVLWANVTKGVEVGSAVKEANAINSKPIAQLSLSTLDGVISSLSSTVVTAKVTDRNGDGIGGINVNVDTNLMFGNVDMSVKTTNSAGFTNFTYTAPPASMLPNTNRFEQFKAYIYVPNAVVSEIQEACLIIGISNNVRDWHQVDITHVNDYVITGNNAGTLPTTSWVLIRVTDENNNPVAGETVYVESDNSIAVPDAATKLTNASGEVTFVLTAIDLMNSDSTLVRFSVNKAYSTSDSFLLLNHNETDPTGGYAADIDFTGIVNHNSTLDISATVYDETGARAVGVPCQLFIPLTSEGKSGVFQGGDSWCFYEYGGVNDMGDYTSYIGSWFENNATVTDAFGQLNATITTASFLADVEIPLQFGIGGTGVAAGFNNTANNFWMEYPGPGYSTPPLTEDADVYYWEKATFTLIDEAILKRAPMATMVKATLDKPFLSAENLTGTITLTFQNLAGALSNKKVNIGEGTAKPIIKKTDVTSAAGIFTYDYTAAGGQFDRGIGFTSVVKDAGYAKFPFNFYIPYLSSSPDNLILTVEPSDKLVAPNQIVTFSATLTDIFGTPITGAQVWSGGVSNTTNVMGKTRLSLLISGIGIQNRSFTTSYNGMNGSAAAGVIVWTRTAIPWFDNMESGRGNWTTWPANNTFWELGNPSGFGPGTAYSGNNCWGTDINGNYWYYTDTTLTTPIFDAPSYDIISFQMWFQSSYWDDAGWVEVSSNGNNWTRIEPIAGPSYSNTTWGRGYSGYLSSGNGTGWHYSEFDISSFPGGNLQARFHFRSSWGYIITYPGWYIDDFFIGSPPDYRVTLTPKTQTTSGTIGETVSYSLTVENTGLQNDIYDFSLIGNSWDTRFYNANGTMEISEIYVPSRTGANISVRVSVPLGAAAGEQDNATITATSRNNLSVSDTSTLITRVGAVHNLDQDIWYPTIQEAVDYANTGDHLWVRNGTYYENVYVNKQLTITGESRETTIIDGGGNATVVYTQSRVSFSGFSIMNGGYCGIWLTGDSSNSIISDNILSNNAHYGIYLQNQCDILLTGNVISYTQGSMDVNGIYLYYSDNNSLTNNIVSNTHANMITSTSISLYNSDGNTIERCNVINNGEYGIMFSQSSNNVIRNCNIFSNGNVGIYINGNTNYIHHNNIAGNSWRNAYDQSSLNTWDDGYPSGGNFWGDYSGNDFYSGPLQNIPGFDGIGDTPYNINGGNTSSIKDHYPFIKAIPGCGPQPITDSTPPQHSHESPAPGSRTNDATPTISVRLYDNSWVNESTIKLYINGYSVKTTKALRSDGSNIYFDVSYTHTSGFTDGQVVNCRIIAKDIHGNSMEYTWSFTVDLTAPSIVAFSPGGADVPRNSSVSVTFSEPMDHTSAEAAFSINPSVSGYFTWSGNTMTFHPNTNLAPSTVYTPFVSMGAIDLAGNHMAGDYYWSFTTEQGDIRIYHIPTSTIELGTFLVVNCDVTAFGGSEVVNCTLYYIPVGGSQYTAIPMMLVSGHTFSGTWSGTIPIQFTVGTLRYYILAYNNLGELATYPETDPTTNPIQVSVIDTIAPGHFNEQPPSSSIISESIVTVSVDITDLSAIKTNTIELIIDGFSVDYTLTLIPGGYHVSYFQDTGFATGTVQCRIIAEDVWGNRQDWAWSFTVAFPELVITKEAPALANPGQTITYWINISNIGTDWAYNVLVTEIYPIGVTFVSSTPVPSIGDNIWFIGNVAPGASMSLQITVSIYMAATGTLNNTVILDYENSAATPFQEQASASTTLISPWMVITKSGPVNADPGETITYTITYMNLGTDTAYNVWIAEAYPVGVTFVDANPLPTIGNNIWFIGNIPPGGSGSIFINVTVIATSGILTNFVGVDYQDAIGTPYPTESASVNTTVLNLPPQHSNESPPIDGYTNDTTPVIYVHVTDGNGVNASTIRLYINGFSVAYDLTSISGGYNVSYWHESGFIIGQVVTCRIVAKDFSGNTLDFIWQFTVSSTLPFNIEIHQGWNLISIPLVQTNTSILNVLSTIAGQWDVAKSYDATTKTWKSYRVGSSTNTLSSIDHTMGIWLHVTVNSTLIVYGVPPANTNIALKAGWNLVGYPSLNGTRTIADALFGTGYTKVEGYDSVSPYLRVLNGSYIMQPGEGYWVYVPADTMWTVSYSMPPSDDMINAEGGGSGTKGNGGMSVPETAQYCALLPSEVVNPSYQNMHLVPSTGASPSGLPMLALAMLLAMVWLAIRRRNLN
jgi:peptide/nickel transport system substrate-binding protein